MVPHSWQWGSQIADKTSMTPRDNHKESQNQLMSKIYLVGFHHDARLSCKK